MIRNDLVPFLVKLEIQLLGEKIWNLKASQMSLISIFRHFQEVSSIIYPLLRKSRNSNQFRQIKMDRISLLWQERIEIIQRGFQLQAEGKISLKKYYEGTETDSLFQLKGYPIKYEAIRKNKFYQQLKK